MKKNDGFSLKELLIVLFIIFAMIAVSIPLFFKLRKGLENSQKKITSIEQTNQTCLS